MSDPSIITRIVTALTYMEVKEGEIILEKDEYSIGIMFIKKNGVSVLGINDTIRMIDLY